MTRGDRAALRASIGDSSYAFAQMWVPRGRQFAALEPMTARTNALVDGTAPLVSPGESFTARFTLTLSAPETS